MQLCHDWLVQFHSVKAIDFCTSCMHHLMYHMHFELAELLIGSLLPCRLSEMEDWREWSNGAVRWRTEVEWWIRCSCEIEDWNQVLDCGTLQLTSSCLVHVLWLFVYILDWNSSTCAGSEEKECYWNSHSGGSLGQGIRFSQLALYLLIVAFFFFYARL